MKTDCQSLSNFNGAADLSLGRLSFCTDITNRNSVEIDVYTVVVFSLS